MTEKIAVLGAGSWGSILAGVLDENKTKYGCGLIKNHKPKN